MVIVQGSNSNSAVIVGHSAVLSRMSVLKMNTIATLHAILVRESIEKQTL